MKTLRSIIFLMAIILTGCNTVQRLPAPDDLCVLGDIPGMPGVRFWGDEPPPNNAARMAVIRSQVMSDPAYNPDAPIYALAISGGGQHGAFGAGLLAGWTASGNRPEFRMVTGISTGALIAPFAFLGPEYDSAISDMYTRFSTKDVLKQRLVGGLIAGDSVTDNAPLREILKVYFTPREMNRLAEEHARGRRLFVGTTHLDVQRPVIWDIGAIASSGAPDAYDRIIDVLLASTAIPGAFPPVYFKVEHNGIEYDELHVDGGVTTQVFIGPMSLNIEEALKETGQRGQAHVYIIMNSRITPDAAHIKPKTVPILTQSLLTLLRAQGLGDMYRIYQDARLNHMLYRAAYIPEDFPDEPQELFDAEYMNKLFILAYNRASSGYPWETDPPKIRFQSLSE